MNTTSREVVASLSEIARIPVAQISKLYDEVDRDDRALLVRLIELGLVDELEGWRTWAETLGISFENPDIFEIEASTLAKLPVDVVRRHRCFAIRTEEDAVIVAMADPLDLFAIDTIQEVLGCPAIPVACPPDTIRAGIEHRLHAGKGLEGMLSGLDLTNLQDSAFATPQRLQEIAGEDAIVELVDYLVTQALRKKASDVHIEPCKMNTRVRYRVDGRLETVQQLPKPLHSALISRTKVLAEMDIAERRRPQDGRFRRDLQSGGSVEFRVSTLPGVQGEKLVLRVLDRRNTKLSLDTLGMSPQNLSSLESISGRANGMLLVTGPTGSGKTTTLYAVLAHLNREHRNLVTVEDPVEYELEGVTQVQVSNRAQRSFASSLRSILRQDPDVVMVGEIRDEETAEIAVHAALTGHMLLSTLHTNSALGTVARLVDMGVAPYLLAPSLRGIVAQRLVRRLCPDCMEPAKNTDEVLRGFGLGKHVDGLFYTAKGCAMCRDRGYVGRMAIHEVLEWDDDLAKALSRRASEAELHEIALEAGFVNMAQDGIAKAAAGLTSLEDVVQAIQTTRRRDRHRRLLCRLAIR